MVVKMAVGPSAPPIIPKEAASLGVNPIRMATSSTVKIPSCAAAPEYGQTQVAQHRPEICQRPYTHKDDRRKEPSLDQHVVNEVHQPQLMRDVMERHLPNVLHHSVHVDHAVFVGLYHTHIASGEVGKQHAERDRYEQQRFILFLIPK